MNRVCTIVNALLTTDTNLNNVCGISIYSRGHGIAMPLQSILFLIGMTNDK